jgi:hypothetical protein
MHDSQSPPASPEPEMHDEVAWMAAAVEAFAVVSAVLVALVHAR